MVTEPTNEDPNPVSPETMHSVVRAVLTANAARNTRRAVMSRVSPARDAMVVSAVMHLYEPNRRLSTSG